MNIIQITALGWIGGALGAVFLLMFFLLHPEKKGIKNFFLILFIAGFVMLGSAIYLYFNTTAVGEAQLRAWHAQSVGIERTVEVYSMDGTLIRTYHGIYNIEYDTERVAIYDTATCERVIIYYKNGTVIVTESDVPQ
jgi:hypothetical protein